MLRMMTQTRVIAAVVAFAAGFAGCGGGSEEGATDAEWVSGFCQAMLTLGNEAAKVTPAPGEQFITSERLKAMAPAYSRFAEDLDSLSAPAGLEEYHQQFVDGAKETADLMAKGDLSQDAFRALEQLEQPKGFYERFGPVAAADEDCQRAGITFEEEGSAATGTPRSSGFNPPAINYNDPGKFLVAGPQSTLSEKSIQVLRSEVLSARVPGAAGVYRWMASTFTEKSAGGATIGAAEVNQLIESRVLNGCHDWALVMTAALRYFGYPSLMVDAAGLQWAEDYAVGKTQTFSGHVFAEVLTNDGWMLVDCTSGRYTLGYDPTNPVIPYTGAGDAKGFYALYKGIDPASYGVSSNAVLQKRMTEFSAALTTLKLVTPDYEWQSFK